jgi:hypothetical protein
VAVSLFSVQDSAAYVVTGLTVSLMWHYFLRNMWHPVITSFCVCAVLYNDTTVSIQWSEFSQPTLWIKVWHRLETRSPYMQLKHLYTVVFL